MELPLLLAALTLLSISSASDSMCSHTSHVAFKDQSYLLTRQIQFCKPVPEPVTCEASCGPGYIQCVSYPNCFNPSAGETCCSDGSYCSKGSYCTDAGCCPTGSPLSDCGAVSSLATLAGTPDTATAAASSAAARSSSFLPGGVSTTGLSVAASLSFDSLFQTTTSTTETTLSTPTLSTPSATTNANGGGAVTQGTARASQALGGAAPERMGANVVVWVVAGFAAML